MPTNHPTPERILVVDDDEPFALAIGEWLTDSGYDVRVTFDGQAAVATALQHQPAVVVADIRMPRLDGLQLLDALKAIDPLVEVIFLSGQATLEDAVAALREGRGFDLLQKPLVQLRRLNVTIERALSRRHGNPPPPPEEPPHSPPVARALAYITANAGRPLALRDVAEALGYSPAYLTDRVKQETGSSVQQWIIQERLTLAEHLLRGTDLPIETVAGSLGYQDPAYFARQFRQHRGATPMAWRTAMRAPAHE